MIDGRAWLTHGQRGGADAPLYRSGVAGVVNRADRGWQTLPQLGLQHAAVLPLEALADVGKLFEALCSRPRGRSEHGGVAQSVITAELTRS
jgi:hypothetical protein